MARTNTATKTVAPKAPRAKRAPKLVVVPFAWDAFWAAQPDLPIVSAWSPVAQPEETERHETRSVVAQYHKDRYAANGTKGRGCGDALWEFCLRFLGDDGKLVVSEWEAFLTENGVRHEGWKRTGNGWQGRFRMSGSVALRAKAKRGEPVVWHGVAVA